MGSRDKHSGFGSVIFEEGFRGLTVLSHGLLLHARAHARPAPSIRTNMDTDSSPLSLQSILSWLLRHLIVSKESPPTREANSNC